MEGCRYRCNRILTVRLCNETLRSDLAAEMTAYWPRFALSLALRRRPCHFADRLVVIDFGKMAIVGSEETSLDDARVHPLLIARLLVLLILASGAPVIAKKILGAVLAHPLDGGITLACVSPSPPGRGPCASCHGCPKRRTPFLSKPRAAASSRQGTDGTVHKSSPDSRR